MKSSSSWLMPLKGLSYPSLKSSWRLYLFPRPLTLLLVEKVLPRREGATRSSFTRTGRP